MAISQLNDAEDDALQGLPYDAQILYLRGLRRQMDYSTGEVGRRSRISWQTLREVLYIEPTQGCEDTGSPSRDRVKRAAKWLERVGLVEMRSIQAEKLLVFFLPLADRRFSVQKKPARNPPDQPAPHESAPVLKSEQKPAHSEMAKPAQYPITDKTNCNGYITEISMTPSDEKPKASAGMVGGKPMPPHVALAVELREMGVDVLPMNPLLSNWISELNVTLEECRTAVSISRRHIGNAPIPAKYLDKVLRSQRNPTPQRMEKTTRRRNAYQAMTGKSVEQEVGDVIDA